MFAVNDEAAAIIAQLQLEPLPEEGGYFRRLYTGDLTELADGRVRPLRTVIYYLMTRADFSALHRLASTETFHFHAGDAMEMFQLSPGGSGQWLKLGAAAAAGEAPCVEVPAGVWQGSRLAESGTHGYALLSTVVCPGFEWEDFTLGNRDELTSAFPAWAEAIRELTRD